MNNKLFTHQDGVALEPQIVLEILCYLAHQPLEGRLADEQVGALLVAADLAQGHSTWRLRHES